MAVSAGLLVYRTTDDGIEVLIVHPGGPWWARRDAGAWSIPKGEFDPDGEAASAAASREFGEELGFVPPDHPWIELGEVRQKAGKIVIAFAAAGDYDADALTSNTFEMEWPPKSGQRRTFPEVDRAEWCDPETARHKLNAAQVPLIDRLLDQLDPG